MDSIHAERINSAMLSSEQLQIVGGPLKEELKNSLLYGEMPDSQAIVSFTIQSQTEIWFVPCYVTMIAREDGSGRKFLFEGVISKKANLDWTKVSGYYIVNENTDGRRGHLTLHRPAEK